MVTEVSEKPTSFSPYEESFRDSGVRTTAGSSDVVASGFVSAPTRSIPDSAFAPDIEWE